MTLVAARPQIEHKTFLLEKAAIDANGTLTGYGAIFGNRDDGGDIVEPGFFSDVLDDFRTEGFISWGHDWNVPCAMPKSAAEDSIGLAISASFHSDEQSQRYRTIAAERLDAGLTMGLSIGYEIAPGGATLEKDGRHLRKASRLFEVGLVMVPMNREAGATDVKTLQKAAADNVRSATYVLTQVLALIQAEAEDLDPADPDFAEDEGDVSTLGAIRDLVTSYIASTAAEVGTVDDLTDVAEEAAERAAQWSDYGWMGRTAPLADHGDRVTADVKTFQKRIKNLLRLRSKESRVLSSANRTRLESLNEQLAALQADLADLLVSADAEKALDVELAFQMRLAQLNGVAI